MQKVIYLSDYNGKIKGDVEEVSNNYAHFLIDKGLAMLKGTGVYRDRMMRSQECQPCKAKNRIIIKRK